jgi:AAA+ ATPase superfamily predicted ATPase
MEFIGRQQEIAHLHRIRRNSLTRGQMTVVTGRRRVGKTRLIRESFGTESYLYFFVARLDEALLCMGFLDRVEEVYGRRPVGAVTRFIDVFRYVIDIAREQQVNLVIDEFQEFLRINPSVYSEIQNHWDANRERIQLNLILSGSVYSLMHKIFQDYNEPLFGRATARMHIRPFEIATLRELLQRYAPEYEAVDLLTLYALSGGVPKYVEVFVEEHALTKEDMLSLFVHPDAIFLEEGKDVLIQEFGKEYTTYFSILTLIAAGKTSRTAIESVIQKDVGGFLRRLEEDYLIVQRQRPLFSKPGTRTVRYLIQDEFLRFWFRFIFKHSGLIELRNFVQLRRLIDRDFTTYTGWVLERLIRQQLAESQQFSSIGQYWQRNGENEIDLIAISDLDRTAIVGEVKLRAKNIDLGILKRKAQAIEKHLRGYTVRYTGFSLMDITE